MWSGDRLEKLARLGFAARGVVYLLVGWFAIRASIRGSRPSDSHSALSSLSDGAGGRAALAVIALGLIGYGIWRILDAAFDKAGADGWGNVKRAGHGVSGFAHILLAVFAGSLALQGRAASGGSGNSQDASARDWSGWLLAQPFGEAVLAIAGMLLVGLAGYQLIVAYRATFMRHLGGNTPPVPWLRSAGRLGFAARGIVFALIGLFLVTAARDHDPEQAGGMAQALATVQALPSGAVLLGLTALGLVLFGLFSLVEARYRTVDAPDIDSKLSSSRV